MHKIIKHYGTPRHSGRYPWGSGADPQRNKNLRSYVSELKKQGLSEVEIAKGLGMNSTQLRNKMSIEKGTQRKEDAAQALKLKDKGYSTVEIGRRMGKNESSVRALLDPVLQQRSDITRITANMLKESVDKKGYIDVGVGVENHIGISRTKLKTSIAMLEDEGYTIHYVPVEQLGTGKKTTVMVLAPPDTKYTEVFKNKDKIKMITDYTEDGGRSYLGIEPIKNVSEKRVAIRYHEDGGVDKDGVIELRRGVDDISLGNAKYAQVRIGVDGTHYLKGMAMYSDDLPDGVDILFNTNKHKDVPKSDVLKKIKDDPDNPFGATVRQKHYIDANGKKELSALNIVNEEGDWDRWSKTLSSQMLSKQSPALAKKQLDLAYAFKKDEYDEIMSLTNPIVRKKLLESFADDCDSSAVHLKAAALPRQGSHVILPIPDMKPTEIYAPNYRNGERVVLIRYPHGGTFEIPELTVNNKQRDAKRLMENAKDAVGIHPKVAERLSGADFDGDTVLVIPNPRGAIKSTSALKGLTNFDPKESYPEYEGMPKVGPKTGFRKPIQMGSVSNLITDMTIKGADTNEIARAVRHSMVVIDAEKHNLDYKKSYVDNGIASLKKKYQGKSSAGASTLISKASAETRVGLRKERVDPTTGKRVYEYTNETYVNRQGKVIKKTAPSTKMFETDDAFTLSSGTPMETVYASYSNDLKRLANTARKTAVNTPPSYISPSAKKVYEPEVASLKAKLNIAFKNKPLERQAQLLANKVVDAKRKDNPDIEAADIKKIKGQALVEARTRVGAKKEKVDITNKEWEAIQAGAVSTNVLMQILNNTDLDKVKQLATPRTNNSLSSAKKARAKSMLAAGRTQAEVADALGVSVSSVANIMN